MVRRCIVDKCPNTDASTIAHRFPRKIPHADLWRKSLNLIRYSLTELMSKYVVCTKHFRAEDYRHPDSTFLNFTAVPQLSQDDGVRLPQQLPPATSVSRSAAAAAGGIKQHRRRLQQQFLQNKIKTMIVRPAAVPPKIAAISSRTDWRWRSTLRDVEMKRAAASACRAATVKKEEIISAAESFEVDEASNNVTAIDGENEEESPFVYYLEEEIIKTDDTPTEYCETQLQSSHDTSMESLFEEVDKTKNTSPTELIELSHANRAYVDLSRAALIDLLVSSDQKIAELEAKLLKFETAHAKMLQNMDSFRNIF